MYLGFDIKYRSSKIHVFLLFIKPVFPMFDKMFVRFAEVRMHNKGC